MWYKGKGIDKLFEWLDWQREGKMPPEHIMKQLKLRRGEYEDEFTFRCKEKE